MKDKRLIVVMIIVAIIGAFAGYYRLGGHIAEKIMNLVGVVVGIWFVAIGIKVNKKFPDNVVKIIKPIKRGKFLINCGIAVFIINLILLFVPQFK